MISSTSWNRLCKGSSNDPSSATASAARAERMVRHHITDESVFRHAENVRLPPRLIPQRHRARTELPSAYEL